MTPRSGSLRLRVVQVVEVVEIVTGVAGPIPGPESTIRLGWSSRRLLDAGRPPSAGRKFLLLVR